MPASYPHSRITSSTAAIYGGNRRRGGAIAHRDGGIIHGGGRIGRTGGYLGPFTAQVNPTGGSPGGPPTLPPIGPSCAGTGYHHQQRGPGEHSQARAQNHGVNVQTLPTQRREQMPPPSIPTFPHQKAKKSRYQQHAVSYNPYNPSFPRDKAEKSRSQQHDLSILIVGPNQLKCRLSRTRKPKSCTTSNTQCPITRCVGVRVSHAVTGVRWCERPSGCRFSSWSSSSASRRPARRRR